MTVKAIDLFAGAGGFTLSAHEASVDVLAAIEFDKAAANTYRKNFVDRGKRKIDLRAGEVDGDINNVDPAELRKSIDIEVGELDLILGGPPCQGFSTHRIKNAGVNDPRNALLLRYFEFVHEFKPKAFLVENVAGLLWKRHKDFLDTFLELAKKEGYDIRFCDIINAKDYGVPQNRKRVFIHGVKRSLSTRERSFPPAQTHFSKTSGKEPTWKSASTVFEPVPKDIVERYINCKFFKKMKFSRTQAEEVMNMLESGQPIDSNDPCNVHMKPTVKMVQRFIDTPLNGSREDAGEKHRLKCHSNGYEGHKDVYGRVLIHQPSNTITTGCHNPSKGRFVHPWKNHGMTLRHAARLQSFPDWFNFYGNTTQQAKQIGNAVPPLLGEILIRDICSGLN